MTLYDVINQVAEVDGPISVTLLGHVVLNLERCPPNDLAKLIKSREHVFWRHDGPKCVALFEVLPVVEG